MPGMRASRQGMERMASKDDLKHAIDLALAGDWDGAHTVAQRDEADPLYCWLHACLHKMEGDAGNEWLAELRLLHRVSLL